jgi:hypothetical protein
MHVLWGIKDLHFNLHAHEENSVVKKTGAWNQQTYLALAQELNF